MRVAVRERVRWTAKGFWQAGLAFYRDHGFDLAAALSYWTLLNTIPFLLVVAGLFGVLVDVVGGPERGVLLGEIAETLRRAIPGIDTSVIQHVEALVAERGTLSTAVLPMILTSSALYSTLETALAQVFEPPRSRSVGRSKLVVAVFLTVAVLGVIALALAWWALSQLTSVHSVVLGFFLESTLGSSILTVLACAGFFVVLVGTFSVQKVPLRLRLSGGLLFGVLWLLARLLFSLYLETLAAYSVVYGSFTTVVVMLVWIYYSASIFLYAAEWVNVLWTRAPRQAAAAAPHSAPAE